MHISACALLLALTVATIYAGLFLRAATVAVEALPRELQATRISLIGAIGETRVDLSRQITAARREVLERSDRQITALRTDVMGEAGAVRETADRRIGDTLTRVDTALASFDTAVTSVESLRQDLKPALDHTGAAARQVEAITAQVNDALPLYLDCDHNPDCVFNRYVGVSKGIERAAGNFADMSQDSRTALPPMLKTWNQIGLDVSSTAQNINRLTKPHWYDRLIGYGLNGAILYRNLNPVTSLTITGAQILTGR
jgi:hypothetical protein